MKKPYTFLMLLLALLVSFNVFSLPVLNSLPSAAATIYLDFDGHTVDCAYWNNGKTLTLRSLRHDRRTDHRSF